MLIVCGVDDTPVAQTLVERAFAFGANATDIHLVHVFNPPVFPEAGIAFDMERLREAEMEAVWANVGDYTAPDGVEVSRVELVGYPPDTLVGYATEKGADLIVVGTRGRGEIRSLILGSTSHRAIHLAECDVLVVKAH